LLAGNDFSSRNLRALRGFAVNPGWTFTAKARRKSEGL